MGAAVTETFRFLIASDVIADAMILEVWAGEEQVMDVWCSDTSGEMTVSLYRRDLPVEVVEQAIAKAKSRFLPVSP